MHRPGKNSVLISWANEAASPRPPNDYKNALLWDWPCGSSDNCVPSILHTPFTHMKFCQLGLLWLLCIVVRIGRWSVSMPAGRKANTECPILFATECELKSLQAIWTERCEEEPRWQQQTPHSPKFTGLQKIMHPVKNSLSGRLCKKISGRWVWKVRKTARAVWEQTMRKRSVIWMLGERGQ